MAKFAYHAVAANGEKVKGNIEAGNRKAAVSKLGKSGYVVIDIKEEGVSHGRIFDFLFGGVRGDDLLIFYVQLHDMIGAGINLLTALDSIREETVNKNLKAAIGDIIERIKKGASFADALERHKTIFPDIFISMVKSGEASGEMEAVLDSYIRLYEEHLDLKQKSLSALCYPAILLLMGLAVVFFLVTFIIPKFVAIFSQARVEMPFATKMLYWFGSILLKSWYILILLASVLAAAAWKYASTTAGKKYFDRFMFALPVIGPLNRKIAYARFAATMSILLKSGVPILHSLELTASVIQNSIMVTAINEALSLVQKGKSFASALKGTGQFPANLIQLVSAGEETGNLDGMLNKARVFYGKSVSAAVKRITVIIEPVLLILIGLAVGFIMASILLPLFKMVNSMKF